MSSRARVMRKPGSLGRVSEVVAAVTVPLLWSNLIRPALPVGHRGRTAANAAFATAYAFALRGHPRWNSRRGLRDGLLAAALVTAAYATALAIPPLRAALAEFADRGDDDTDPLEWITLHIPLGTVYSEELIFRATLTPLLTTTLGPHAGPLTAAATFGLWHIEPARAAADNIPGTILITTLGGLAFDQLARRSASTTAPALLHFALNAGGVLAPRLATRSRSPRSTSTAAG